MNSQSFIIDEQDRYARFRLISWWDQEHLAAARVMVVGAGALGNEVIKNPALLGIGHIDVIDFDRVEHSNLNRSVLFRPDDAGRNKAEVAAQSAREICEDTETRPIAGNVITEIGLGYFRDSDVVIGCLDNREARLWVNRMCWKVGTPWIDGGIQEINGVAKVFVPPDGPCYECGMTETDYRLMQLRYSCPLLTIEDMQEGKVPTAPTVAAIIAGFQTQEALKLLHKMEVASGSALVFNGISNQLYQTRYPYREDCLSHETYEEIIPCDLGAHSHTAADLFSEAQKIAPGEPLEIQLDAIATRP